jgi:hypothetical protein
MTTRPQMTHYTHPEGHSLSVGKDHDGSPYWEHTHATGQKQTGGGLGTLHQHLAGVHGEKAPSGKFHNEVMPAAHAEAARFGYSAKKSEGVGDIEKTDGLNASPARAGRAKKREAAK